MKKQSQRTVWVVINCEIIQPGSKPFIDEVVFHVSSSLRQAEKYLRSKWVVPFSWWKVQQYNLDGSDESDEAERDHLYTHTGKAIKTEPYKRALASFKKDQREQREQPLDSSSTNHQ